MLIDFWLLIDRVLFGDQSGVGSRATFYSVFVVGWDRSSLGFPINYMVTFEWKSRRLCVFWAMAKNYVWFREKGYTCGASARTRDYLYEKRLHKNVEFFSRVALALAHTSAHAASMWVHTRSTLCFLYPSDCLVKYIAIYFYHSNAI